MSIACRLPTTASIIADSSDDFDAASTPSETTRKELSWLGEDFLISRRNACATASIRATLRVGLGRRPCDPSADLTRARSHEVGLSIQPAKLDAPGGPAFRQSHRHHTNHRRLSLAWYAERVGAIQRFGLQASSHLCAASRRAGNRIHESVARRR